MEKYIRSVTALNELTLSTISTSKKGTDEVDRYAESDIFWAANKRKSLLNRAIKKGNVYQFEFGKNFVPEMSYEHRGLVIGISGKLLYVLPICSYNVKIADHQNAYHPIDNPTSKSNFFLLKGNEHKFLRHDSVLKLNDIRTVSVARIKYKQENGYIDPQSDTYKAIEKIVLSKYFFSHAFELDRLAVENKSLKEQLDEANEKIKCTEEKMDMLREMILTHGFDEECQACLKKMIDVE